MPMRSFLIALVLLGSASMAGVVVAQTAEADAAISGAVDSAPTTQRADRTAPRPEAPSVDKVDVERESLARIAHELAALKAQVRDAARGAPTMVRVQFRYDWLESDLALMERGIQDHLDAPRQPRAVVPLKGDYRR
jgi:RAQPRD family integrative conjugative element protein